MKSCDFFEEELISKAFLILPSICYDYWIRESFLSLFLQFLASIMRFFSCSVFLLSRARIISTFTCFHEVFHESYKRFEEVFVLIYLLEVLFEVDRTCLTGRRGEFVIKLKKSEK